MFLRAEIREGRKRVKLRHAAMYQKEPESSCNHLIDSLQKKLKSGLWSGKALTNRDGRAPSGYDRADDQELFAQHL